MPNRCPHRGNCARVLVLLVLLLPTIARAEIFVTTFDDVEIYPMAPITNVGASLFPAAQMNGIPAASCLTGKRTILLPPGTQTQLTSGSIDDYLLVSPNGAVPPGTPLLTVEYPADDVLDLTFGAVHDRFRFRLVNVHPELPVAMRVAVTASDGSQAHADVEVADAEWYVVLFSAFDLPADRWTQIQEVRLHFTSGPVLGFPTLGLHRIELMGATIEGTAVQVDDSIGPIESVPPPPYEAEWTWTDPSGGPYEQAGAQLHLARAIVDVPGAFLPFPGQVEVGDDAEGTEPGSTVFVRILAENLTAFASDFTLGFEPLAGGAMPSIAFPPDPIHVSDRLVVVQWSTELFVSDVPFAHAGFLHHRAVLEIPATTPATFESVEHDGFAGAARFDLELGLQHVLPGPFDGEMFTMVLTTEWQPHPSATSTDPYRAPWSSISLVARPNVTDSVTQLWLDRSLPRRGTLEIFDQRGRAVRRMPLEVGARFQAWDGRDQHGMPLGSGVYFARIAGQSHAPARITLVR